MTSKRSTNVIEKSGLSKPVEETRGKILDHDQPLKQQQTPVYEEVDLKPRSESPKLLPNVAYGEINLALKECDDILVYETVNWLAILLNMHTVED